MAKSFLGKALKVTLGVTAAVGAAAAASIAYGLKKWAEDEDSNEIKITTGGRNGIHIAKTEDGKYVVNTKYDWASDVDEDDYAEDDDGGIIIDISGEHDCCDDACCCDSEKEECCGDAEADSCCEGAAEDTTEE